MTAPRNLLPIDVVLRAVDSHVFDAYEHLCRAHPTKRVYTKIAELIDRGYLECGVSSVRPWLTDKGRDFLAPTVIDLQTASAACVGYKDMTNRIRTVGDLVKRLLEEDQNEMLVVAGKKPGWSHALAVRVDRRIETGYGVPCVTVEGRPISEENW